MGRRVELSAAKKALSKTRLLTLTGPGGVGKTRLALRLAECVRGSYPDGVGIVELASLETGDLLEATVAETLGLHEAGPDPMTVLMDHLSGKRMLLVLDNCEHLQAVCARFVERMLRAAPRLRILTTSRQTLGVYGEQVLTVPSLSVPDSDGTLREIARHDSVRLFIERTARILPGFSLKPGNAACVARLAKRLEGIPLAIELAAARLRSVPLEQLARELDERFDVLAAGTHAVLPRHRTLRATMDWSYRLCSAEERRLWARLSMFPGGVDLDTAEAVCSGEGIDCLDVLDLLSGLVDKSVLVSERRDAELRYRMLECLRAYGWEQLTFEERRLLRERYVRHFRDFVETHRADRLASNQVERYLVLRRELPNLRVAVETCMNEPPLAPMGLTIASAMWAYWLFAGSLSEGRYWLDRGLERVPEETRVRATALWVDSMLALRQGDLAAALPRLEESDAIARRLGDRRVLPYVIRTSGVAAFSTGDTHRGFALLQESLALHRAVGDLDGVLFSLYFGAAYGSIEDPAKAAEYASELLALSEAQHARISRSYAQLSLGLALWNLGECGRAEELVTAAARFAGEIGDRWCLTQCLEVLAWAAGARGDHMRAAALLGAADVLWQTTGAAPERLCYHADAHQHCARQARRALGRSAFASAFRTGTRLGPERTVAYAAGGSELAAERV